MQPPAHTFGIWNIHSISEGKDTLGDVTVRLYAGGRTYTGKGLSTDGIGGTDGTEKVGSIIRDRLLEKA